jgi:hypothetical protein
MDQNGRSQFVNVSTFIGHRAMAWLREIPGLEAQQKQHFDTLRRFGNAAFSSVGFPVPPGIRLSTQFRERPFTALGFDATFLFHTSETSSSSVPAQISFGS